MHIRAMPFLWLAVPDPPGPESERGVIEVGAIRLLSNLDRTAIDPPSPAWLGRSAARDTIRRSGLWNVSHVTGSGNADFLSVSSALYWPCLRERVRQPQESGDADPAIGGRDWRLAGRMALRRCSCLGQLLRLLVTPSLEKPRSAARDHQAAGVLNWP